MGQLKPNAEYIYERQDGVVYMREKGAPSQTREAIGWDWQEETNTAMIKGAKRDSVLENQLWYDIRQEAKSNPTLQIALDRVILMYRLSKTDPQ